MISVGVFLIVLVANMEQTNAAQNLTKITWSHATNSKKALENALKSINLCFGFTLILQANQINWFSCR